MTDQPKRYMMEIDPDSPNAREILQGAKGPAWQWFAIIGIGILIALNIIAAVTILGGFG